MLQFLYVLEKKLIKKKIDPESAPMFIPVHQIIELTLFSGRTLNSFILFLINDYLVIGTPIDSMVWSVGVNIRVEAS